MEREVVTNNVNEMSELASRLATEMGSGEVLLLTGELGSGKTTFTQSLAKALGVRERISSPTFNIVLEYEVKDNEKISKLIHADLYRLLDNQVRDELAIMEILERAGEDGRVTVIEWAEKLGKMKIKKSKKIFFEHGDRDGERKVVVRD